MSVAKNVVLMPGNTQHISPVFLSDDINNDHSSCPQQSLRLYPPSPPSTMTATTPVSMASAPTSPQSPLSFRNDFTPSKMPWYSSQNTSLRPIAQHIPRPSIESDNSSANFFNLDRLMQQYGEQPELLELILSSKVEEDRRRAEEAKLKRKEIDYLLLQKQQDIDTAQRTAYRSWRVGSQNVTPCEMAKDHNNNGGGPSAIHRRVGSAVIHSTGVTNDPGWRKRHSVQHPLPTVYDPPPVFDQRRKSNSNIEMLLSHTPDTPTHNVLPPISASIPSRSLPVPSTLLYSSAADNEQRRSTYQQQDNTLPSSLLDNDMMASSNTSLPPRSFDPTAQKLPIPPSTPHRVQRPTVSRRRRRREMQAISTIIETREFPYNDDYLWKNNGNTIHKKTGLRSIYYKCSNSAKGCPVNKTVTFKENGEYLIKYRGQHLDECSRIKRIIDV